MKKLLIILILLSSCSKEEQLQEIYFQAAFSYPHYKFDTGRLEVVLDGVKYGSIVDYHPHGVRSGTFGVPFGKKTIESVVIYEGGKPAYLVLPLDSLNTRGGLIIMGVPYYTNENIYAQLVEYNEEWHKELIR